MEHTITPETHSFEQCFKDKHCYHIDFYQRNYNWETLHTDKLLEDIFSIFEPAYLQYKSADLFDEKEKCIVDKYKWYYLGIYITTESDGKEYIMDGQQRLTTLTLIATKLHHMIKGLDTTKDHIRSALQDCIYTSTTSGVIFRLDNETRKNIMSKLLYSEESETLSHPNNASETEKNLCKRYEDISKYLNNKFVENGDIEDPNKLYAFTLYFLRRITFVELKIAHEDAPMVFEVINDRGKNLQPFEILKGKLIGTLVKSDINNYCKYWNDALSHFKENDQRNAFFATWVRSKYIYHKSHAKAKNINNTYHRFLFEDDEARKKIYNEEQKISSDKIKNFIEKDLTYYAKLYHKITTNVVDDRYLKYVQINELSMAYQNILAACCIADQDEEKKITTLAKEHDRLNALLYLNDIHTNNLIRDISYELNEILPKLSLNEYRKKFDEKIKEAIKQKKKLTEENVMLLDYGRFSNVNGLKAKKFFRYFFSRIEEYIRYEIIQNPTIDPVETIYKHKKEYDIEHTLANNSKYKQYFSEEEFARERDKLGGLLLLHHRSNRSTKNDEYDKKTGQAYLPSDFFWNKTHHELTHSYPGFKEFNEKFKNKGIAFKPYDKFDKQALEERTKLLYELVKIIWEVE